MNDNCGFSFLRTLTLINQNDGRLILIIFNIK